jgi:hypothetical protein
MFLGRLDEARALYFRHLGEQRVLGAKSWVTVIREDFAELRQTGLMHPLMDEIEQQFGKAAQDQVKN